MNNNLTPKNKIGIIKATHDFRSFFTSLIISDAITQQGSEYEVVMAGESISSDQLNAFISFSPSIANVFDTPCFYLGNHKPSNFLTNQRFTRNMITYDGYLFLNERTNLVLKHLHFGLKKPFCPIGKDSRLFPYQIYKYRDGSNIEIRTIIDPTNKKSTTKLLDSLSNSEDLTLNKIKIEETEDALTSLIDELNKEQLSIILIPEDNIPHNITDIYRDAAVATCNIPLIIPYSVFQNEQSEIKKYIISSVNTILHKINENPQLVFSKIREEYNLFLENCVSEYKVKIFLNNLDKYIHERGFIESKNNNISVNYIIRTGGDNPEKLFRAIKSIIDQSHKNIKISFVTHKNISKLRPKIEKILKNKRIHYSFIEQYNSSRSSAIIAGMKAVNTDYFGLLDDDDYLAPNHVESLLETINRHSNKDFRGIIRLAYSGSYYDTVEHQRNEKPEWIMNDYNQLSDTSRVIEHFRFYTPDKISNHNWYLMSNSWLAHSSLIDEEMLEEPGTHTCEDLYFCLLMATKTYFAFSGQVTARHTWSKTNSTHVDSHMHKSDTVTHGLRLFSRLIPSANLYNSPFQTDLRKEDLIEITQYDITETIYSDREEKSVNYFEHSKNNTNSENNIPKIYNNLNKVSEHKFKILEIINLFINAYRARLINKNYIRLVINHYRINGAKETLKKIKQRIG